VVSGRRGPAGLGGGRSRLRVWLSRHERRDGPDPQAKDGQWSRSKSYDTFGPCGPRLVPAAEIADLQILAITMDLNGQWMQASNTANMIFGVRALIEFIRATITLEIGDVISTGTPDGIGAFRSTPVFLKPGDEMTVTVEGIGSITNHVVSAEA